jgi:hypothetical protein
MGKETKVNKILMILKKIREGHKELQIIIVAGLLVDMWLKCVLLMF